MTINERALTPKTSSQNEILVRMGDVNKRLHELDEKVIKKSETIIEVLGLPAPKNPETLTAEEFISHVQKELQNMPQTDFKNSNHKHIQDSIAAHYNKFAKKYCALLYAEAGTGSEVLNLIEGTQHDDNEDSADITGENSSNETGSDQ